jgi:hypothetical protein
MLGSGSMEGVQLFIAMELAEELEKATDSIFAVFCMVCALNGHQRVAV